MGDISSPILDYDGGDNPQLFVNYLWYGNW